MASSPGAGPRASALGWPQLRLQAQGAEGLASSPVALGSSSWAVEGDLRTPKDQK